MSTRKYTLILLAVMCLLTVLRVFVAFNLELGNEEVHLWQSSRHTGLSYYDQSPVTAYLVRVSTWVLGDTLLGVRSVGIISFLAASLLLFMFVVRVFDARTAFWSTLLLQVTPAFLLLSVTTVPDTVFLVIWIAYVYVFYRMLLTKQLYNWYVLGMLFGVGVLVTYNAFFLLIAAVIFLACVPEYRAHLKQKYIYVSALIGAVIFFPSIIWNYEFNFLPFVYRLDRIVDVFLNLKLFAKGIAAQAMFISPLLLAVMLYMAGRIRRENEKRILCLLVFSLPFILFYNSISAAHEVWAGYVLLVVVVIHKILEEKIMPAMRSAVIIVTLMSSLLVIIWSVQQKHSILPVSTDITKSTGVADTCHGWQETGVLIQKVVTEKGCAVFTDNHITADALSFYIPSHPEVYCLSDGVDHYDFYGNDLLSMQGWDAVVVTGAAGLDVFGKQRVFKNVKELNGPGENTRIFLCGGFYPNKLFPGILKQPQRRNIIAKLKHIDNQVVRGINTVSGRSKILDTMMIAFSVHGNGLVIILYTGVLLWVFNRSSFGRNFLIYLLVFALGGLIIQILKGLYNQPRPLYVLTDLRILLAPLKARGFPSGHTYAVFTSAVYLADRLKHRLRYYIWFFYGVAVCGGISRMYVGAHYLSDVIGGAVMGVLLTLFCIYIHRNQINIH